MQYEYETDCDEVNDRIAELTAELKGLLDNEADAIRPHEAALAAEVGLRFADLSGDLAGDEFLDDASNYLAQPSNANFIEDLSDKAIANLLLKMPITKEPGNPEAGVNKRLALEAAEALGPDWAQSLYRFAVLVTKLA